MSSHLRSVKNKPRQQLLPLLVTALLSVMSSPALGQVNYNALKYLMDACPPVHQPSVRDADSTILSAQYETHNVLTGEAHKRQVVADLYLPQQLRPQTPVLIMSPGWGSHYKEYAALARYLTAQNFAVVTINHPGSNEAQKQAVCKGEAETLVDANEFIDRSRDVTQLLDQLEIHNQTQYQGRLNLKQVGIYGYSLGGLTALTLAGAQFNFSKLHCDCLSPKPSANLSLTALCLARQLPQRDYGLQDERIKAVFVINPVSASIFGSEGLAEIDVPVLWMAGDADLVTPLASEHLPSFRSLKTEFKYLAIAQGAAHVDWNIGPDSLQTYLKTFGLAFFQVHVANRSEHNTRLTASYAKQMSQRAYPLSFR